MSLTTLKTRAHNLIDVLSMSADARAILRERLTYLGPAKLRHLESALRASVGSGASGDIIEFGVALGGSAILLAKEAGASRRFFGLDVFGMIPPPASDKDDVKAKQRYEQIVQRKSKGIGGDVYYGYRDDLFDHVREQLGRHGTPVDGDRVNLVKGLFEETWPTLGITEIAFAHIDCDWYEPVKFCLKESASRLSRGGTIVIDDYFDYAGCRTAVDEFLQANPAFELIEARNPEIRHRRS